MSFVGIVSDCKCFENIKEELKLRGFDKTINLIHINQKSIQNMKNIKFEIIIINNELEKLKNYHTNLEKICSNTKYLLLNTDINQIFNILKEQKSNIITYGLNQKSTVTVSSIGETDILIYLQRNIKNNNNKILEVEEKRIKRKEKGKCKVYDIMIIYLLYSLYDYPIIDEI